MTANYDILILGGGPGGYVAALHAARLKLKVGLIDEGGLGGTCLHRGCIPSKAWIASAELALKIRAGAGLGINVETMSVDWSALVKRQRDVVQKLAAGTASLLKAAGVEVISGRGLVKSSHQIDVAGTIYEGKNLILAIGTEPVSLPSFPVDGRKIFDTNTVFGMEKLPASLLIVGGGISGCEFASMLNALGVQVTVAEKLSEILVNEEPIIVRTLKKILQSRGVTFLTGTEVSGDIRQEAVLVTVGRKLAAKDCGLDAIGVNLKRGFISVNDKMETSVAGVFAIGDCVGTTLLAHGASREGVAAVNNIMGKTDRVDYHQIPYGIFTIPEIAGIGIKEKVLKEKGIPYKVGRFSFAASGKALCDQESEGSAMILSDGEDKILGASIIGHHATDMIAEIALAMRHKLSASSIGETVHSHPTYSEIVKEAALDTYGMAHHKAGPRG